MNQGFTSDCSFDPAGALQHNASTDELPYLAYSSPNDEHELIKAARAQFRIKSRRLSHAGSSKIAMQALNTGPPNLTFAERLAEVMQERQGGFPTVEIEYNNLTVVADALVGSAGNPTMWNSFKSLAYTLVFRKGLETRPLTILDGVSGVIKPGRLTLLLGPPGAGKSVFLQVLSGRLHQHKGLRVSGDIKYNGKDIKSFVVQRTAGLVDQYDHHIPNLTVAETVKFASDCQTGKDAEVAALVAVEKASIAAKKDSEHDSRLATAEEGGHIHESALKNGIGNARSHLNGVDAEEGTPRSVAGTELSSSDSLDANAKAEFLELMKEVVLYRLRPYITLHLLGLSNVADTFVGNETLRGVSGGEKKRVTSAEVMAGPQWALFMDEISTGLDSATTYSVVKYLRDACHALDRTIVISLLQPAPEVMNLFDDLLLLTDGKVIYHGPVSEATGFFSSLGFVCPERKDPASFLQEVTTPLGQLAYATDATLDKYNVPAKLRHPTHLVGRAPRTLLTSVDEIAAAFWASSHGKEMRLQLDKTPCQPQNSNPAALARTHYARSGIRLAVVALRRQMVLVTRDKAYYIARTIQAVIIGLIIASLFATVAPPSVTDPNYSTDIVKSGRKAIALMVISLMYISMSSMPSLGFVFNTKRVFYKQRDNHFFPSWSYVVGLLLAQVLPSTVESVLFTLVVYFISGLTRSAANFFIFMLVAWSSSNCLAGMFRLIAYFTPSMVVANASGALFLLFMMLTNVSGFY